MICTFLCVLSGILLHQTCAGKSTPFRKRSYAKSKKSLASSEIDRHRRNQPTLHGNPLESVWTILKHTRFNILKVLPALARPSWAYKDTRAHKASAGSQRWPGLAEQSCAQKTSRVHKDGLRSQDNAWAQKERLGKLGLTRFTKQAWDHKAGLGSQVKPGFSRKAGLTRPESHHKDQFWLKTRALTRLA